MSGTGGEAPTQPWAADGRYGSDWSSNWRIGGANDPSWSNGGPGEKGSGGVIFDGEPVELARGLPVKYDHRCASDDGPIDRAVLIDRKPFQNPTTPRIENLGKCPVFLVFASAPRPDGRLDNIKQVEIPSGTTLDDGLAIPDATDSYGVYCKNCSEGMMHITIERGMV